MLFQECPEAKFQGQEIRLRRQEARPQVQHEGQRQRRHRLQARLQEPRPRQRDCEEVSWCTLWGVRSVMMFCKAADMFHRLLG